MISGGQPEHGPDLPAGSEDKCDLLRAIYFLPKAEAELGPGFSNPYLCLGAASVAFTPAMILEWFPPSTRTTMEVIR